MLRLDHLLCLVSPALPSSTALRQAGHLAAACDATVHVMAIGEAVSEADARGGTNADGHRFDKSLDVEVHEVGRGGDDIERTLQEIQDYVATAGVGLVVSDPLPPQEGVAGAADRWRSALGERLDCPVFMVDACGNPDQVERILVPTDLSSSSENTLRQAVGMASCYGASIVLLHVLEASPYVALTPMDRLSLGASTLSEHRARRQLHQLIKKAEAEAGDVRPRIAFGAPADQIVRFVDENKVDLVVLSSRSGGPQPGRALGPVTDGLLRRLSSPLFLVRTAGTSLLPEEGGGRIKNQSH